MDFYFVLSDKFLYDKYSGRNKYNHEMRLMDKLWCYAEEGKNYNNSLLYLQIVECALKQKSLSLKRLEIADHIVL